MSDIIDDANDAADLFLESALHRQRKKVRDTPKGIGICLTCGVEVEGFRRWCGPECRDEWEAERR
jgi:hypothetical protein